MANDFTVHPPWRLGALFALLFIALAPPVLAHFPPATPGVMTVSRSDSALHAFWYSVGGATGYHVTYRGDNGVSWQLAALNHPEGYGTTCTTITRVDNDKPYAMGVRARNHIG